MELVITRQYERPGHQQRLLQTFTEDVFVFSLLVYIAHYSFLDDALYKSTYLLTYLLRSLVKVTATMIKMMMRVTGQQLCCVNDILTVYRCGETCYLTGVLLKILFYLAEEDLRRYRHHAGEFLYAVHSV